MRRKPEIEILAPAGSLLAMEAAAEAGCDAVYLGGNSFGARAFADSLSEEDVIGAIDYMHLRGKSLYLTVNTLLKEKELVRRLYRYMERFCGAGLDAAIVQDVGVLRFLHRNFPELPLHASTQMTITAAEALPLFEGAGVTRIVTSRELCLSEIRMIRERSGLEIEAFVHGALCYCYSGQCLMSSLSGARSGNRGRCTQPCRMPYRLIDPAEKQSGATGFLLSPKDICTLRRIPDLVDAGIRSFKIEGRMKRPEYAAFSSYAYRKWTDRYLELGRDGYEEYREKNRGEMEEDIRKLADLYNRGGFSEGYYGQRNGKNMMAFLRPNHNGVPAVKVEAVGKKEMRMRALTELNAQDVIEIRNGGTAEYEFTLKNGVKEGAVFSGRFLPGSRIRPGMEGYRTKNDRLLSEIGERWLKNRKKLPAAGVFFAQAGKPMELRVQFGETGVTVTGPAPEPAQQRPVSAERVAAALSKMGGSPYEWQELRIETEENLFFAMSALNNLRREAFRVLEEARLSVFRREIPDCPEREKEPELKKEADGAGNRSGVPDGDRGAFVAAKGEESSSESGEMFFSAGITGMEQLGPLLASSLIRRIYLSLDALSEEEQVAAADRIRASGKELYYRFPAVSRSGAFRQMESDPGFLPRLAAADGILLSTLEEAGWFLKRREEKPELSGLDVVLQSGLYVWNREAEEFWRERGIVHMTAPLELTKEEWSDRSLQDTEIIGYGYLPVMVSAQCVRNNTSGCVRKEMRNSGKTLPAGEKIRPDGEGRKEDPAGASGPGAPLFLQDRNGRKFPVVNCCRFCYNTIYHPEPLNLCAETEALRELGAGSVRLDFTLEDGDETRQILSEWERSVPGAKGKDSGTRTLRPYGETSEGPAVKHSWKRPDRFEGHFRRGVE